MAHNILENLIKEQEPIWVEISYEEERLMKEQSKKFLKKVLTNEFEISPIELRFLMRLFEIKQNTLAHALGLSEDAVSMQLSVLVWIPSDNRKKIGYPVLKNFKFQNRVTYFFTIVRWNPN